MTLCERVSTSVCTTEVAHHASVGRAPSSPVRYFVALRRLGGAALRACVHARDEKARE